MSSTSNTLKLEKILVNSQSKMQALFELLKIETNILKKNNTEAFEEVTAKKVALTEEIESSEKQRSQLLISMALNPNEPSQWLLNNKLKTIWNQLKTISEQAQKQNQINGLVINGNRRRIETKIQILSAATPSTELVYSASGENVKQRSSSPIAQA